MGTLVHWHLSIEDLHGPPPFIIIILVIDRDHIPRRSRKET